MTSIRIVCMDHYMSTPVNGLDALNSEFRGSNISKVPIIRIFGTTNKGDKACLHIHGVFPYIYIPYDGSGNPNSIAYQLASSLDKSINISMGQASSNNQHVYKITLISAFPFYGYHTREHQFFKISFYNPYVLKKASALLQNGSILGKIFQPHECHIPYHQQFMIDYNLHGMNFIRLLQVQYRTNVDTSAIPENATVLSNVKKMSVCKIEMDGLADDILNRLEVSQGKMTTNPGIQYICEDEKQRRRNKGIDTQLSPCLTQNRTDVKQTFSYNKYKQFLMNKLESKTDMKNSTISECSVYAAETPDSESIVSASSSVSDTSFLEVSSLDMTSPNLDESIMDNTLIEEDANFLMSMMKDNLEDSLEEDSILSQVPKPEEEDVLENELDLSMPLASVTTPVKHIFIDPDDNSDEDNIWNDSFFIENAVLTPADEKIKDSIVSISQLDGQGDSSSDEEVVVKKRRRMSKNVSSPFPALQVIVQSPARTRSVQSKSVGVPINQNDFPFSISKTSDDSRQSPHSAKSNSSNASDDSKEKREVKDNLLSTSGVKRKLSFADLNIKPLDKTYVEEHIVCQLTPSKISKNKIITIKPGKILNNNQTKTDTLTETHQEETDTPSNSKSSNKDKNIAPLKIHRNKTSKNISETTQQQEKPYTETSVRVTRSRLKRELVKYNPVDITSVIINKRVNKKQLKGTLSVIQGNLSTTNDENSILEDLNNESNQNENAECGKIGLKTNQELINIKELTKTDLCNEYNQINESVCFDQKSDAAECQKVNNNNSDETDVHNQASQEKELHNNEHVQNNIFQSDQNYKIDEQKTSKNDEKVCSRYEQKLPPKIESVESRILERVDIFSNHSDDLFSPENSNDSASLHVLNKADRYDAEANFVPAPGPSRDARIVISGESLSHKSSEVTSSSSGLTPSQKKFASLETTVTYNADGSHCKETAFSGKHMPSLEDFNEVSSDENYSASLGNLKDKKQNSDEAENDGNYSPLLEDSNNVPSNQDHEKSLECVNENLQDKNHKNSFLLKDLIDQHSSSLEGTNDTPQDDLDETLQEKEALLQTHNLTINPMIEDSISVDKTDDGFCVLVPKYNPPSCELIKSTMQQYNIPLVRNEDPYYSDFQDVTGSVEVGYNVLKIKSKTVHDLDEFSTALKGLSEVQKIRIKELNPELKQSEYSKFLLTHCDDKDVIVAPANRAPTRKDVELWLKAKSIRQEEKVEPNREKVKHIIQCSPNDSASDCELSLTLSPCTPVETKAGEFDEKTDSQNSSLQRMIAQSQLFIQNQDPNSSHQITGATLNNTHGFKMTLENYQEAKSYSEHQYITTLVIELHIQTRADFMPDPEYDAIRAIFYSLTNDVPSDDQRKNSETGMLVVNVQHISPIKNVKVDILEGSGVTADFIYVDSEAELFAKFLEMIQTWDPDILIGYEIEMLSWGYLIERGYTLGINFLSQLSRIPDMVPFRVQDEELHTDLKITGRVVLDLWRLMRHEIALTSYTFENIMYHVLHERAPLHSKPDLTNWWLHRSPKVRKRTVDFYFYRVKGILRIIDHFDLIGRTSELARLFGILFYEVLSRGSQFRVESMMLRMAKPLNYIPVSPSVQQRANMRAPEYLPLILEPESKFYKDPVIVLDFQSLYPSIIIAYNYCFSTSVGRVEHLGTNSPFEFGATQLKISRARVEKLLRRDQVNFSPCGVGFVKKNVRHGILPRMLQEILDTRLLVKKAMKDEKGNKILQRVFHSRQLGLKLIANVTYGYTAANFSGRMPAVEVGDSVVAKGRETLQRAINMVENNKEWGARVVYGDTDSLFVLMAGKSREEAFRVGAEIAEAVTEANPSPVRLKLEKVYQPCILQTKKRYVGYMYESVDQKKPDFDAKGIETVRRDGCPAASKMLEKCLRMLFETRDISPIKQYVLRQFHKLLSGRVSIQDLTFAKEYRGAAGYKPGACVPALELARKWKTVDRRKEPRSGERVPYIIINGPPGLPLIKLVRSPRELLDDSALKPNAIYYITKVIIPPINRCFSLIGADLNSWFNEMPRKQVQYLPTSSPTKSKKSTISQYFATTSCACCGKQTKDGLCEKCLVDTQYTAVILHEKIRQWEQCYHNTYKICQSCCGRVNEVNCISLDCPVLYRLVQTRKDLQQTSFVRDMIKRLPDLNF